MEYGFQGLDTGLKVKYLLNGIRCDKSAVITVRAHADKYEKDFYTVVAFLTQYINKRASSLSVKVASFSQIRPAKWQVTHENHGTFKGKVESKNTSGKIMTQCQWHSVSNYTSSRRKLDS